MVKRWQLPHAAPSFTTGGDMKRSFLLLTLVLVSAWASAYAQYRFTSLDYPGGTKTFARGINDRGTIVGAYRINPPRHALVIRQGKYMPLDPNSVLGGLNFSEAFKINNHGDVVGDYDDGATHGFLLHKGELTTLDFPGADLTLALDINDSGVVVGEWDILDPQGNTLAYHGFIWKDGAFTDVEFPGSSDTSILGINNKGEYVGIWDTDINAPTAHGFVSSQGEFTSFDAPSTTLTEANDINDEGQIVGLSIDVNGTSHGFLKMSNSFTAIDYPGAASTEAWGINSKGEIVGVHVHTADSAPLGFIAKPKSDDAGCNAQGSAGHGSDCNADFQSAGPFGTATTIAP
jgi:probable HAF family extracellular repeat protein